MWSISCYTVEISHIDFHYSFSMPIDSVCISVTWLYNKAQSFTSCFSTFLAPLPETYKKEYFSKADLKWRLSSCSYCALVNDLWFQKKKSCFKSVNFSEQCSRLRIIYEDFMEKVHVPYLVSPICNVVLKLILKFLSH